MGFGKSFKKAVGKVASSIPGVSELGNKGLLGPVTEQSLDVYNRSRQNAGLAPVKAEQMTAANVFRSLSPAQQKDLLINNPNIETALGSQYFDPLTNTIKLQESDFTKEQRLRQEALAKGLTSQLGGELPSTDPTARFEQGRELLAPQFQEDRERLEQQLADQGIPRGSEAFNEELNRLEQSQARQLQELSFNSVQTAEAQRAARFNEISSLLGQQQVGGIGFNQFQPQASGLDLFGAEQAAINRDFQNMLSQRQNSTAKRNALIGALGSLGSSTLGAAGEAGGFGALFSDRILKENIELVDYSNTGIPIYQFEYINKNYGQGRFEGVMAQDLIDIKPEALIVDKSGYYKVDYSKLDVNFKKLN